jgi:PAS domain S-box-containing protein
LNVLLVEDNPITRRMLRATFESGGYTVAEAGDGASALEAARRQPPDLVVTDFVLPDRDGLELLADIRSLPRGGAVPAILVTGMVSRLDSLRDRAEEDTHILPKPVEPARLLEVAAAELSQCRRTLGGRRRVLVVDDESLNRKLAALRLREAGFEVGLAASAAEALAQARLSRPEAILSDVLMPGTDGFVFCHEVRRDPALAATPVVLVSSAYVEAADRELARQVGATALVVRTPDYADAVAALVRSLDTVVIPPPAVPQRLPAEHQERVQHQLDQQLARNLTLARQSAIQSAAFSLMRGLCEALSHPKDLRELIGDLLVHCLDAAGLSTGLLYVLEREELKLRSAAGVPAGVREYAGACFGEAALFRRWLEGEAPLALTSADAPDASHAALLARFGHPSAMAVPFVVLGKPFGLLLIASDSQDFSEPAWLSFAKALAAQFGQAVALGQTAARLAASEERYRSLLHHAHDAVVVLDPDGTIQEVNAQAENLLAWSARDLVGRPFREVVAAQELDDSAEVWRRLAEVGHIRVENRHVLRKDGAPVAVDVAASRIAVGEQPMVLAILRDVSERERAEQEKARLAGELEHERQRVSGIVATVPGLVWESIATSEGFLATFVSDYIETLTGYSKTEWLRSPSFWLSIVHPEDQAGASAESRRIFEAGAGTMEFRWIRKDGRVVWVQTQIVVTRDAAGQPAGMRGVMLDVTKRKQAEQALAASERRLRDSQAIAHIGSWEWEVAADRAVWSDELYCIFGVPRAQPAPSLAGFMERIHPEDRERMAARVQKRLGKPGSFADDFRIVRPDGEVRVVSAFGHVESDSAGRPVRVFGAAQDVTDQRRLGDELRQQREALYQNEKLAAMGQLLAGVAHELNNPLAVVLGQSSLLRKAVAGGPQEPRVEKIMKGAERCSRIVKNFLALARQHPPERGRIALNQVVQEALELFAYPLKVDGIQVDVELAPELPPLWADGHQLHQVLINLVTNAHHALRRSAPPRRLTVSTRRLAGERLSIDVADSGPGIAPEIQERIFEPFFTTKPEGQGTGLGLPLCRAIVENHSGRLSLRSAAGEGAVFTIELPVGAPDAADAPAPAEAPRSGAVPARSILVVDDEAQVAELLGEILSLDGHRVVKAGDGLVALAELGRATYDLVVSDLRMPGLDGPGLYRAAAQRFPGIEKRFVFVTGDTLEPATREFLDTCIAPHLAKPFTVDEALRVLSAALAG